MAGYATVMKSLAPDSRVVGAEPAASALAQRSLAAGERLTVDPFDTIADGQRLRILGALPFEALQRTVDVVVSVTDAEIVAAMRFLFERLKVVAEPSGAIALAALLASKVDVASQRVGVILSGGNIDVARFSRLLDT